MQARAVTNFIWRGAVAVGILAATNCCSRLVLNGDKLGSTPAVVLRGVFAGWIITTTPDPPKTREFQTWEIRIALDGRVQENRGWQGADGFLPQSRISPAEAKRFYDLVQSLAALPDYVGRISTDVPYRQIEYTTNGQRRTISGYDPINASDTDAQRFRDVWNEIAKRFPEPAVCRD